MKTIKVILIITFPIWIFPYIIGTTIIEVVDEILVKLGYYP